MSYFTEEHAIVMVLAPDADLYDPDPATDVVNTENFEQVTFILMHGIGATGTVKIEVEECTAADGSGNTAIAFNYRLATAGIDSFAARTAIAATGYTTVAGSTQMVAIEINAAELSDGSPFVRLQLTEVVDSPVDAAVICILGKPRYPQATQVTSVA